MYVFYQVGNGTTKSLASWMCLARYLAHPVQAMDSGDIAYVEDDLDDDHIICHNHHHHHHHHYHHHHHHHCHHHYPMTSSSSSPPFAHAVARPAADSHTCNHQRISTLRRFIHSIPSNIHDHTSRIHNRTTYYQFDWPSTSTVPGQKDRLPKPRAFIALHLRH